MAKKPVIGFGALIDLARKFVEIQKGVWDNTAWLDFLSDAQKEGVALSDDMKTHLGSVLEAMKKVYEATSATKGMENIMLEISKHTVDFIKYTQGIWTPAGGEAYLKDLQKRCIELTDETNAYLGEVLEATRSIYTILPAVQSKAEKKATSKKK